MFKTEMKMWRFYYRGIIDFGRIFYVFAFWLK